MQIKNLIPIVIAAIVSACGPKYGDKTVDYPYFESTTAHSDVVRVQLTDSATFVTLKTRYFPHSWIKWSEGTVLKSGKESWTLTGGIGMVPGEKLLMGESGDSTYTMIFSPIPVGTKVVDISEGEESGAFQIYGIDLTGKWPAEPSTRPSGEKPTTGIAYSFDEGISKSRINVHLLHYRYGLPNEVTIARQPVFANKQQQAELQADENGCVTYEFTQRGTEYFMVIDDACSYAGLIAPGETIDVYLDMARLGQQMMAKLRDGYTFDHTQYGYSTGGRYPDFITAWPDFASIVLFSEDAFEDCTISADEYYGILTARYNDILSKLKESDLPEEEKKSCEISARQSLLYGMVFSNRVLENSYYLQHPEAEYGSFTGARVSKERVKGLLDTYDFNDPNLLVYGHDISDYLDAVRTLTKHGIVSSGMIYEIGKAQEMYTSAMNAKLTDEQRETLNGFSWTFLKDAIESVQAEAEEILSKNESVYRTVDEWPGAEEWMKQLVDPYKGKVVMIDLWNTWCSPCRNAIKVYEPYKNGELSSENIAWIYIADESSELATYMEMIGGIRGDHWMLSEEQIRELDDFFQVDGIPFYILVEKDGSFKARPDLRDHNKYVQELKGRI